MFVEETSQRFMAVSAESIAALYASVNAPLVQLPGHAAEHVRAVICASRAGEFYEVQIGLYLEATHHVVIYRPAEGSVAQEALRAVLAEALAFAENLGLLIDSMRWNTLDAARRAGALAQFPVFFAPEQRTESAGVPDARLAMARLLVSF